MSGNYSAGQFDLAFKPIRLLNYHYGTNPWPGKFAMCSPIKRCSTCFIADDRGHMLPCIARNPCSSPWGDYATWIWEQTAPCCCISMLRHPENFKYPPQIYIAREVPNPGKVSNETACEFNDPCTKEGMVEDILCGRDPCCPGQQGCCPLQPCKLRPTMMGDCKAIQKELRAQRRVEKRSLMTGRGRRKAPPPCPEVINLRFALGCGEGAKHGCKKYKK